MTVSNKSLIIAIAALALAIAAAVAAKFLLAPPGEVTYTAPLDTTCDLQAGPCSSAIPGGGRIELAIAPRPIPLLQPLRLNVKVQGMEARAVEVDLTGVDMNMGFNRPKLQRDGSGQFSGQTTLPVCITGRMAWQAVVVVTGDKAKVAAPFRFITTHN
ncbi:hypothetical protein SKTS_28510 [Sulfurimicrobium lacus]|uniref:YtkA-like domain-containing protein n=1 Tax=Sulfurimicrobium lacus TaxID=2715678 RepID=A0A6F8VGS3_9PROT|nr:hypothetical protein [Sulfurimicrobium lacus]BCB27965.1 hypothetical protein SKTS_28510 [Sulfurimicrobium lacus]